MEKYRLDIKTIDNDVIYTTFGKNTRLEIKNCLGIGKIGVLIQRLDSNNKQVACITFYLDKFKALVLANDILSSKVLAEAKLKSPLTPIFECQGGSKTDKGVIFRSLTLAKGDKAWILKNNQGPGKVTSTGGITPEKIETSVAIGLNNESLKMMALAIKEECLAYRVAQILKAGQAQ